MSAGFRTLDRDVKNVNTSLSAVERKIRDIKALGIAGGALAAAGGFGLSMFKGPLEASFAYEQAYARFKQFNLGDLANKQADQFARATETFGSSSKDLMDALNMSMGVFGRDEMGMAYKIAPVIASLNAANASIFGGKVEGIDAGSFRSINRFIDMRGLGKDEVSYMHGLDVAQKIISGSGGTIQFRDLEQFAKRGGTAFKSLSDEGLFNMVLSMQEMGGSTAGQSLMSLYQNLVAGRTTKKAMAALSGLGLVNLGMVPSGALGGDPLSTVETKSLVGADMARTDPMGWLRTYLLPKLEGRSQDEQFQIINSIFSNRNASNLGALGIGQILQVARDANMGKGAFGVSGTLGNSQDSPMGRMVDLHAKYNTLLTEFGEAILPIAIKALEGINAALRAMNSIAKNMPLTFKMMTIALGVLAAGAAGGGLLMVATAGFRALGLALTVFGAGQSVGIGMAALQLGLKGLGTSLMWLAGIVAAWEVGSWIGKTINDNLLTGKDWSLGSNIYGWTHAPIPTVTPYPNQKQPLHATIKLHVDGRQMAEVTARHWAQQGGRAQSGTAGILDPNAGLLHPATPALR